MKEKQFVKDRFSKNVFAPTFDSPLVVLKSPKRDNIKYMHSNADDVFRYDRTSLGNPPPDAPPPPEPFDPVTCTLPRSSISPITATTTVIDRLPDAPESPIFTKTIKPSFEPKCTSPTSFLHTSAFPVIDGPFTDISALPQARASTSALRGTKLAPLVPNSQSPAALPTASSSDLSIFQRYNSSSTNDGNYQIHSRMMGWKLTSPERRKWLLNILANHESSTQELSQGARNFLERDEMFFGDNRDDAAKRILKRQTTAESMRYASHRRPSVSAMVSDLRYRQLALQEELAAMEKASPLSKPLSSPPKPAMNKLTLRPSSPTTELLLSPTRKELLETARILTDERRYNRLLEKAPLANRPHTGTTDRGQVLLAAEKHRSQVREQYLDAIAARVKEKQLQRPKSDNSIKGV